MVSILVQFRDSFARGDSFDDENAETLLDAMIGEADELLLASVFTSWNRKGVESNEIYAVAKVMRDRCAKVNSRHENVTDIVGTGGSKVKTFNVSTAAAFVVAGSDVPIAKHGNKAATSNSGSADVLAELRVGNVDAATAEKCLEQLGICFMFAPNHHRLSPTLAKVRRGLGFPTIFNCVGPLCNPAGAQHQLIGVWHRDLVPKIAKALAQLGTQRSWVVHGSDGLDEITLNGPTYVAEVDGTKVREFEITPADFGFDVQPLLGIRVSDTVESASMIERILGGEAKDESAEKIVVVNAASAIYLAGRTDSLLDAARVARASIRSESATGKLNGLREMTAK